MKDLVLLALYLSTFLTLYTYLSMDKVLRIYGMIILITLVQAYG